MLLSRLRRDRLLLGGAAAFSSPLPIDRLLRKLLSRSRSCLLGGLGRSHFAPASSWPRALRGPWRRAGFSRVPLLPVRPCVLGFGRGPSPGRHDFLTSKKKPRSRTDGVSSGYAVRTWGSRSPSARALRTRWWPASRSAHHGARGELHSAIGGSNGSISSPTSCAPPPYRPEERSREASRGWARGGPRPLRFLAPTGLGRDRRRPERGSAPRQNAGSSNDYEKAQRRPATLRALIPAAPTLPGSGCGWALDRPGHWHPPSAQSR